jgi:hypothetical protein
MKEVRATELGYYGDEMIPKGKVFTVPDDFKAKWVQPADAPWSDEPPAPKDVPTALSQMKKVDKSFVDHFKTSSKK